MTVDPSFNPSGRPEPVPGDTGPTPFVPVPNGWGEAEGEPGQFNAGITAEVALRDGTLIVDLGAGSFQLEGEPEVLYMVAFVSFASRPDGPKPATSLMGVRFIDERGRIIPGEPVAEDGSNTPTSFTSDMVPLAQETRQARVQVWISEDGRDRFVTSPPFSVGLTGAVPVLAPEAGTFKIDGATPTLTPAD